MVEWFQKLPGSDIGQSEDDREGRTGTGVEDLHGLNISDLEGHGCLSI